MPSSDVCMRLATTFAPTLVIFPEKQDKVPYDEHRPLPKHTGDYHPCPVELVLDNFWLCRGRRRFRQPWSIRRGRPRSFSSEREWLFALVKQGKPLSDAVINLKGVDVNCPTTAWDTYFSIISHPLSRREDAHPYPILTYARVLSGQDIEAAGQALPNGYNLEDFAVQYWFFYYYNYWWNLHEMDWEMITLIVRSVGNDQWEPLKAAYAAHMSGHQRQWSRVHCNPEAPSSPLVFVAAGSHASYFEHKAGGYYVVTRQVIHIPWLRRLIRRIIRRLPFDLLKDDMVDIVPPETPGRFVRPQILLMPCNPTRDDPQWWWTHFPGMWGEKPDKSVDLGDADLTLINEGPRGPWKQGLRWNNPFLWVEKCRAD